MRLHGVAQLLAPGLQLGAEEAPLALQVAHRRVVAGDQVAHHLADGGDVVFGLAARLVACQAERGQLVAQRRQRPLVEEAAQVEGAVEKHLRLAHALEQRVVLGGGRIDAGRAHRRHQRAPGRFEEGALLRRLRHRDAELPEQRFVGRGHPQPREQAVELGAREFLAVVGSRETKGGSVLAHRSVILVSFGLLWMSITRQSPHICRRFAASPWKALWPASLSIIASMARRVPKGLPQRMQR